MNKKQIIKLGYDYAYDCGTEITRDNILLSIYTLATALDISLLKKYKTPKSYSMKVYGDMLINPFNEGTKQFSYFNFGVLTAYNKMKQLNKETDNVFDKFKYWCFDGECDNAYSLREAVNKIYDINVKNKCMNLLSTYESGISASIDLIEILASLGNSCPFVLFDSDYEILKIRTAK
jgi:hypothetical protein